MIKRKHENEYFTSHELALVASLIGWNFPLVSINRTNDKKVSFVFHNSPELKNAVDSFWNDTGLISPKKYFYALREAKSRIYGGSSAS